jgi:hypothetical protein
MSSKQNPHPNGSALSPLPAAATLDTYFLEARAKLLDVAAILDRIQRGPDAPTVAKDPRLAKIFQALELVCEEGGGRAEKVQQLFSLDYDPAWQRPQPR